MKKISLVAGLLIGVAGCASTQNQQPDEDPVAAVQAKPISAAEDKIADAADQAANANQAIAEVEVASQPALRAGPTQTVPPNVVLPDDAIQPVSIDWSGPVEPLLEAIATRSGYALEVSGNRPTNDPLVTVRSVDEPLYGVVRRIGVMSNGYADVVMNPSDKILSLRYGG